MVRYRLKDEQKHMERPNYEVKVLKDNEFINEFQIRPNDAYWKTVEVI
jgi:hypothetical protein